MSSARFDKTTFKRLINLVLPVFYSEIRYQMFGLMALLVLFALSIAGINVVMSFLMNYVMTALSVRDENRFLSELGRYLLAIGCLVLVAVMYRYTEERFSLKWRRWLSHYFLNRYLSNRAYYSMLSYPGVDNPDQRIEEDIRTFSVQCVSFSLIIFNSIIALIAFFRILWTIDPWLPIAAIAYAGIGSLITYLLGKPLIHLNMLQLMKEANYRYKLINLRENAESIAFYGSEQKEFLRTRQRLRDALKNLLSIINWNRNLGFFTHSYNYLLIIVPTVIVAPRYMSKEVELGVVTQAQGAFGQVLGALSLIVTHFAGISAFAAVISRLGTFSEAIEHLSKRDPGDEIQFEDADLIELDRVTIYTPKRDQLLLKEISVKIDHGGLLITGPSGCGKSSTLRIFAGIWTSGEGKVIRPKLSESLFIPQKPYASAGTLRSQLQYSLSNHFPTTEELWQIIKFVGLTESAKRAGGLDVERDWPRLLSTGELQRLAWARLFLRKPRFAFLDEATTAIDIESERRLYERLCSESVCWVSVGVRQSLYEFHSTVLELTGDGDWRLVCPT